MYQILILFFFPSVSPSYIPLTEIFLIHLYIYVILLLYFNKLHDKKKSLKILSAQWSVYVTVVIFCSGHNVFNVPLIPVVQSTKKLKGRIVPLLSSDQDTFQLSL